MLQLLVLERIDPAQNLHRYYVLSIEPSLFGDLVLRREWGRLGHGSGTCLFEFHAGLPAAREAPLTWLRRKSARGYRQAPVLGGCSDSFGLELVAALAGGGRVSKSRP